MKARMIIKGDLEDIKKLHDFLTKESMSLITESDLVPKLITWKWSAVEGRKVIKEAKQRNIKRDD